MLLPLPDFKRSITENVLNRFNAHSREELVDIMQLPLDDPHTVEYHTEPPTVIPELPRYSTVQEARRQVPCEHPTSSENKGNNVATAEKGRKPHFESTVEDKP
ncbi:hypothetical protein FRC18_001352 [Serendipita sp. 400]|nr:hypothetical protein FRC18_001352 [Serendipita sp. 400]